MLDIAKNVKSETIYKRQPFDERDAYIVWDSNSYVQPKLT
jgi:hypothetical protein